jgi:pimeloyl-ACP methyl ester carboxylesterase
VARWHAADENASAPLLFFTGIGATIELLAPFLARFQKRDVITFDMPGVGQTPDFPRSYRLSAMAAAAREILDQLGYDRVDVMGVSWGGMLAQEFSYRYQQQGDHLVLAATTAGFPMIPGKLSTLVRMMSSHRYADAAALGPFLQSLYGGSGEGLDNYASRMVAPSNQGYMHQIMALAGWTSMRKLTCVGAKTLILMGSEDKLVPSSNGYIMKLLLKDAALEIIEGAGHLFVLTHADRVRILIEIFIERQQELGSATREAGGLRPATA